ncbi:MAG TPA: beta-ketoacyl-ACP synthase II [Gaiellaceae bacterium]|jgi:3-oxoacyl-[acyl-carrier-protein] synthase II|nr:beta-ketoacyl-ACP synthase II [Gaiellaceae bacterium]
MTRIAVTGIGAVSPLGLDAPTTWSAALAGQSGIDWISAFDTEGLPIRIAAEVKGFDPQKVASAKDARKLERNVLFALSAAGEALEDSGLRDFDPTRVGIIFGSAIGGVTQIAEQAAILRERGPDRVAPSFLPNVLVDTASGQLAISLGIKGVNYAIVSACATGSHTIGEGAELIKRGWADAIIAGGTEACVDPLILAGFTAMRGLAAEDEHPPRASRPFDATRAGFVIAEGAGAVVLEDWDKAEARGAEIYAEVLGYGASNDAHHLAQPEPEAEGVAAMMSSALERAGVAPERVGYLNAHGTSTPLGDIAETKAIKNVFGAHAYKLAVSSTKSMMGHTFGAAGAIESIMCILALRDGVLPPTINYRNPDPDCDLDYVPNEARHTQVDVALSNAMGLGGHNGCVLFGRA